MSTVWANRNAPNQPFSCPTELTRDLQRMFFEKPSLNRSIHSGTRGHKIASLSMAIIQTFGRADSAGQTLYLNDLPLKENRKLYDCERRLSNSSRELPPIPSTHVSHHLSEFPFFWIFGTRVGIAKSFDRQSLFTINKVNLQIRTDWLRFEQRSPETFLCFDLQIFYLNICY